MFQLKMAKLLAIIYALVMCLVLISIIIDMASNFCSPTSVFFYTVAGTFIFSAILHPQVRDLLRILPFVLIILPNRKNVIGFTN